jgi:hypothetical protein
VKIEQDQAEIELAGEAEPVLASGGRDDLEVVISPRMCSTKRTLAASSSI